MSLSVKVLGPLGVERSGRPLSVGGPKPQLLLAVLVTHRDGLVADRLCDALWADAQPASATATVQSHLSRLRRVLEPEVRIETRGSRYVLDAPADALDVDRFEAAAAASSGSDVPAAIKAGLGAALALWRGPAFGDLADNPWIQPEAVRLDELRLSATERWIDARLATGEDLELVGDLQRLVAVHPLRECFWRQLMLSLHRSGRQAEALRCAADLSRLLREELGLDPSPAVRDLERRILADDPALHAPTHEPRPVAVARVVDLPTRLVGRDGDIEQLTSLMCSARLVTLIGPGGVGKTRLAQRLGAEYGAHGHPATMVDLAAVREAASTAAAVATALDVQQRQHATVQDTLTEVLRDREQLVVLDNCEHVIGAVASLVEQLISSCPRLQLLATSRESLGVAGEVVYTVAPLTIVDDADIVDIDASPAVQLFCDRAAAARSDFAVTPALLPIIARLCRRLDGLPLAIELAAVRARSLGPQAMIERLDRRFSLLDAGPRQVDQRHQNIQNMVAWSYDLLTPGEQRLFMRLSIFAGSFDLHAVDAICAVDDDQGVELFALVDRSMVQVVDFDEPRYHLLETLREFGRSRLDETNDTDRLGDRHLAWFLDLAERANAGMTGPHEGSWSDRLERDFGNLRAAHAYATRSGNVDAALRLVAALREFSFRRIRYEVTSWASAAVQMAGAEMHEVYPTVLGTVAYGHFVRGDLDSAMSAGHAAADAATRLGVDGGMAARTLGNSYFYLGHTTEALRWMERMVASAEAAGDPAGVAHVTYMHSVAETSVGRSTQGEALAREVRAAAVECGSPTALAQADYAMGVALESTSPSTSRDQLAAAAARGGAAGNRWIEAFAETEVFWIEARLGRTDTALRGYERVIETWYRGGDWANQWLSIRHVLGILQQIGQHEAAAVVHGGLSALGVNHALPFEPADAARLHASVDLLRTKLGDERFAEASQRGSQMPDHVLVSFVLDTIKLALEPAG
ncbi:MAG: AAA family ATPase [Actinomycetota bacterium]|nr:AAA family ATPase [Actinomycetota bacterium]